MLLKNRILAFLAALALTAALTAGVLSLSKAFPAPQKAAEPGEDITYLATGVASDELVALLDGNGAPAELLTYQIGYVCAYLDYMFQMYGMDPLDLNGTLPDGQNAAEYVRSDALDMLKQQLVLENLAARCNVTLSAEDEADIAAQREADIAEYGEDGYREELRRLGLSEEGYDRIVRASHYYRALYAASSDPNSALYASDEVLAAYAAEQGYITADHILIPTIDLSTREALSDEQLAENRALAESLLWQLRDSRDPIALFKELADEYSQDTGRLTNPDGYTFAEGTMVDEFDAAARALEEGEYSDLVETSYGFHIILRKPLDTAAAADAVRDEYFDSFFLDEVEAAELELTPAAERFDAVTIYEALKTAQAEGAADETQEDAAPAN